MHLPGNAEDFVGNNGLGRYAILPGAVGRARRISNKLSELRVIEDEKRGHSVFLGSFDGVDLAVVPTGMGPASCEIIVSELIASGVTRFLRIGTAGSLQPQSIRVPSIVIAQAAVRDEDTSRRYLPVEFPAVASPRLNLALRDAAVDLGFESNTFEGCVHTKSAFYAREFGKGPQSQDNKAYMRLLHQAGVLATEMECSLLFILAHASAVDNALPIRSKSPAATLAGSVLAIVGDDTPFASDDQIAIAEDMAISVGLRGLKVLHSTECT